MVVELEANRVRRTWPRGRPLLAFAALGGALTVALLGLGLTNSTPRPISFPGGKRFAFSWNPVPGNSDIFVRAAESTTFLTRCGGRAGFTRRPRSVGVEMGRLSRRFQAT